MHTESPIAKILLFIGFLVVASFALNIVLSITGSLIGFAFRWGIPLLIAYFLVRWVTGYSQTRQRNQRRY